MTFKWPRGYNLPERCFRGRLTATSQHSARSMIEIAIIPRKSPPRKDASESRLHLTLSSPTYHTHPYPYTSQWPTNYLPFVPSSNIAALIPCASCVINEDNDLGFPAELFTQQHLDHCYENLASQYDEYMAESSDSEDEDEDAEDDLDADEADSGDEDLLWEAQQALNIGAAQDQDQDQAQIVLPLPPLAIAHPVAIIPIPPVLAPLPAEPSAARRGSTGCAFLDTALELSVEEFRRQFGITQEGFDYAVDRLQSVRSSRPSARKIQRTIPIQLAAYLLRRMYTTHTVAARLSISEGTVAIYRKRIIDTAQELGVDLNELLLQQSS
ncbi:hypothetical protein BDY19DRAFT_725095 [Irpex rosettiformis]|uniref:Uncharacterized protein n=1 Tax=Irpex rosettiformis TaxID=378272 RepID=A0ACB8U967_9APHY|nr:hypothetical protein BDY19DRAFT_725095 [Irpex rosettiformis]